MNTNTLFFGDNLFVLRSQIPDCSVDLIYLDPPFNSNRNYFVLFKDRTGQTSAAQEEAFTDTWTWSEESEATLRHIITSSSIPELSVWMQALKGSLRESSMMAYIVSMAARLIELHRVLKPTGSLYLHCDSTASHYLRLLLDVIFGPRNFRNEIIWQRTNIHSDSKTWSRVSDTIFFYSKSDQFTWNPIYTKHDDAYVRSKYRYRDLDGRLYRLDNMTSPNPRPNMMYEWKGHSTPSNGWRYSRETMSKLDAEGRIWYPDDKMKRPQLKRFLDEMSGTLVSNVWTDIPPINSQAGERLGYPTQKPLALLERIIKASSNPGDVVLDPFCGCGTAVVAAHALQRKWIGIDITAVAVGIIKSRLEQTFPELQGKVVVNGFPLDVEAAQSLFEIDPHLFEAWACTLIDAFPLAKKGSDRGLDGWLNFIDLDGSAHRSVVQVKGGKHVSVQHVRDFCHVITREKADIGFFLCMADITKPMRDEAIQVGFWTSAGGVQYPIVQILRIEDLLSGRIKPKYPPQHARSLLGYKAPIYEADLQQDLFVESVSA